MTFFTHPKVRLAFWLSFLVYLLPVSSSALGRSLWGLVVWETVTESIKSDALLVLSCHLTLFTAIHALSWVLWFAFIAAKDWRLIVLVPVGFVAVTLATLQGTLWVRLALIPDLLLLRQLRSPAHSVWPEVCSISNSYLLQSEFKKSPPHFWVLRRATGKRILIDSSNCEATATREPLPEHYSRGAVGFDSRYMWDAYGESFLYRPTDWQGITHDFAVEKTRLDAEVEHRSGEYLWCTSSGEIIWDSTSNGKAYNSLFRGSRLRVRWDLISGHGSYQITRGRGLFSPDLHLNARLISFLTSNEANRASVPDEVLVLRASDGVEIFRAYVPALSRPLVRFVGNDYFVFTDFKNNTPIVRVFRIADDTVVDETGSPKAE